MRETLILLEPTYFLYDFWPSGVQESIKNRKETVPAKHMSEKSKNLGNGDDKVPENYFFRTWELSGSILVPRSFQDFIWVPKW